MSTALLDRLRGLVVDADLPEVPTATLFTAHRPPVPPAHEPDPRTRHAPSGPATDPPDRPVPHPALVRRVPTDPELPTADRVLLEQQRLQLARQQLDLRP